MELPGCAPNKSDEDTEVLSKYLKVCYNKAMVKPTESLPKAFNALGDSTRFELFKLIAEKHEICTSQLAEQLHISAACVSQHMKVLADAGLINRVREGQRVCYEINTDSPSNKLISTLVFNTK